MAIIEGTPWYFYPERPGELPPPIDGVKLVTHWNHAKSDPYFLTDFVQNGYIVLTENGQWLTAPGWVCERAKLPHDWTYNDGEWKITLIRQTGDHAIFMAATF